MTTRRHISSGSPWEALAGYSRAVVQPMPGGDWIFVAGTLGMDDPASGRLAQGAEAQTQRALDIVERALAQAQARLDDTVRVVAYVPERADIAAVAGVLKQRLGAARPANTTVCCPLAVDGARVELEITALRATVDRP
jgi:enamine deaminase RidA (YjgF/YER057c/UK114 family)